MVLEHLPNNLTKSRTVGNDCHALEAARRSVLLAPPVSDNGVGGFVVSDINEIVLHGSS